MINKNIKVGIVGAGPGGLAAAEALRDKGFSNIVVLEKSNRVGGQADSLKYKVDDKTEIVYELGSLQPISTGVGVLHRLMKRYHMHCGKDIFKQKPIYLKIYNCENKTVEIDFTKSKVGYPLTLKNSWLIFLDVLKLIPILYRYQKVAKEGYTKLSDHRLYELSVPFEEWVDNQHFHLIGRELKFSIGTMLTLAHPDYKPTMPALKLFKLLFQCLKFPPRYINGTVKQMREGYQELWKRVAANHNVRLNTKIKKITRAKNDVVIELNDGEMMTFEKLIIACSPAEIIPLLDVTEEENAIFSKVNYCCGWRAAFLAKGFSNDAVYAFLDPYFKINYSSRLAVIIPEGKVNDEVWLYTCAFSYNKIDNIQYHLTEAEKFLKEHFNANVIEWLHKRYWSYYNPYFSCDDVKNNMYKRLEALQGKNNTYYIGALFSGGTHPVVANYAYKIITNHFKPIP